MKYFKNQYKFCPKCKGNFKYKKEHNQNPRFICQKCGFIFYINPAPTVSAIIIKGTKVLFTKRAIEPLEGEWDLPGGFLELNETAEEGLKREIKEELGVDIRVADFIGSFVDRYGGMEWTINFYYFVKIVKGKLRPADDVAEIAWFDLKKTPKLAFEHGGEVIKEVRRISLRQAPVQGLERQGLRKG